MYRFTYSHRYILYICVIRAYAHLMSPSHPSYVLSRAGNYRLFYGFVSTTGALNILVLATAVAQLAIRAVTSGRIFRSEPWKPPINHGKPV